MLQVYNIIRGKRRLEQIEREKQVAKRSLGCMPDMHSWFALAFAFRVRLLSILPPPPPLVRGGGGKRKEEGEGGVIARRKRVTC